MMKKRTVGQGLCLLFVFAALQFALFSIGCVEAGAVVFSQVSVELAPFYATKSAVIRGIPENLYWEVQNGINDAYRRLYHGEVRFLQPEWMPGNEENKKKVKMGFNPHEANEKAIREFYDRLRLDTEKFIGEFCKANAIKYLIMWRQIPPVLDVQAMKVTLDLMIYDPKPNIVSSVSVELDLQDPTVYKATVRKEVFQLIQGVHSD